MSKSSGSSYHRMLTEKFERVFDDAAAAAGLDTRHWTLMGPDPGQNGAWSIAGEHNVHICHLGRSNLEAYMTLRGMLYALKMVGDPERTGKELQWHAASSLG